MTIAGSVLFTSLLRLSGMTLRQVAQSPAQLFGGLCQSMDERKRPEVNPLDPETRRTFLLDPRLGRSSLPANKCFGARTCELSIPHVGRCSSRKGPPLANAQSLTKPFSFEELNQGLGELTPTRQQAQTM